MEKRKFPVLLGLAASITLNLLLVPPVAADGSGTPTLNGAGPSGRIGGSPPRGSGDSGASFFYLFDAEALGYPEGLVEARFDFRIGERILASEEILLRFGGASYLLTPIPAFAWTSRDLHLLVFVNDHLVNDFDLAALMAYNRGLRYSHWQEMEHSTESRDGSIESIDCGSPCGGGCGPWDDYDCDGVANNTDNCIDDSNPQQLDCDGDGLGDVCDGIDGNFQPTGPVKTCMTDKDIHWHYRDFEHHVEQRLVDVSSCGSPDRWNRWVRDTSRCVGLYSDSECCLDGLSGSIEEVGDNPGLWCGGRRDIDYCH